MLKAKVNLVRWRYARKYQKKIKIYFSMIFNDIGIPSRFFGKSTFRYFATETGMSTVLTRLLSATFKLLYLDT